MRKLPTDNVGLGLRWVGCLQIMLDLGKDADGFDSGFILIVGFIALVGFIAFLIWEFDSEPRISINSNRDALNGTALSVILK